MNTQKKDRLYIAYGSNLNVTQMGFRCPTAEIVGPAVLKGWCLKYRGGSASSVATVERRRKSEVPVLVWRLQPKDEAALDRYEGYPVLYRKETLRIAVDGHRRCAMIYIMNENGRPYGLPSAGYYQTILEGYRLAGFDEKILEESAFGENGMPPRYSDLWRWDDGYRMQYRK